MKNGRAWAVRSSTTLRAIALGGILWSHARAGELAWEQLPTLPDPLGLAAPFAGMLGDTLLVAGGANFPDKMPWEGGKKVWLDKIYRLETLAGHWQLAGQLPRPLAYGISITTTDGVVCIGGSDAQKHYPDCFRIIRKAGTLATEPLPPLPISLASACGSLLGTMVLVVGGAEAPGETAATNRTFALDLTAQPLTWKELPKLPGKPRILATAAVWKDRFFVLGGAAIEPQGEGKLGRTYLREAWSYQRSSGWHRCADLPRTIVAAPSPAPVLQDKIYLLGGDDGSLVGFTPLADHPGFPSQSLRYDPALDHWSEGGSLPAARATVPTLEYQGSWIIPSGEVRPGVRSPQVWSVRCPKTSEDGKPR